MTGNFAVTATMRFLGKGAEHRKAGIMVRQSLDADATYADVVIHGNGMPGLQWRSKQGEDTNTFDLPFDGPGTFKIKLVRTGVRVFMYIGKDGAELKEIAHTEVSFRNPVLVGLQSARIRRTLPLRSCSPMFQLKNWQLLLRRLRRNNRSQER